MSRIFRQEKWQEISFDGGQRTYRLETSDATAIAFGFHTADSRDTLVGNQHVAQFASESFSAFDDVAVENNAAAQARSDHYGHGGFFSGSAENIEVPPARAGISVIQIADRFAEPYCQSLPDVVFRPIGVHEIRGTFGAKFSRSARRPRRIQSNGHNFRHLHTGAVRGNLQAVFNLLQAYFGPLLGGRRMLAQAINQKLFVA